MHHLVTGSTHHLPDVERFIETLNQIDQHPTSEARTFFASKLGAAAFGHIKLRN